MSERIKIIISVLLVLSIVCFSGSVFVYQRSEALKDDLKKSEENRQALEKQISEKEKLIKDKDAAIQKMEVSIGGLNDEKKRIDEEIKKVQAQLTAEISQRKMAETNLQETTSQLKKSKADYESLQAERTKITAQLDAISAERSQWTAEKEKLADKLASAEAELVKMMEGKKAIELNTIVVKAPAPTFPSSEPKPPQSLTDTASPSSQSGSGAEKKHSLEGRVLIYNPEYDFVVIDLGDQSSIYEGKLFDVLDRDQIIGKIRVEKVYDRMSAAVVIEKAPQAVFRKNIVVKSQEI